jgi:hypothetical protein
MKMDSEVPALLPDLASLALQPPMIADAPGDAERAKPKVIGAGGSVYMTYVNACKRGRKRAIGSRPMTKEELHDTEDAARKDWGEMTLPQRAPYQRMYDDAVRQRQLGKRMTKSGNSVKKPVEYRSTFGIGDAEHVILPKRFCQAPCLAGHKHISE